jgi:hypothetical protein
MEGRQKGRKEGGSKPSKKKCTVFIWANENHWGSQRKNQVSSRWSKIFDGKTETFGKRALKSRKGVRKVHKAGAQWNWGDIKLQSGGKHGFRQPSNAPESNEEFSGFSKGKKIGGNGKNSKNTRNDEREMNFMVYCQS